MQKLTYSALFVVGVFIAFWMFGPDHRGTPQESNSVAPRPWATSPPPVSPPEIGNKQNDNNSIDISVAADSYCSDPCIESLELLRFPAELNDDEYEKLLNRSNELAAYLRQSPAARAEFLELASTADGDKRSIIMTVFNQLDINARWSLGEVLIESSDWHNRFDGVNFLAQPDIMDDQLALRFSDMLFVEPDYYVRRNIIKAFSQPDKFYGNQEILYALEQVGYSDLDNTVRGEALLARVQLEQEPETVFFDALSAIRSNEADYQGYGLRAFEQIVMLNTQNGIELSLMNEREARTLFDELMSPEYDEMPADLRNMASGLYERHF